MPGFGSTSAATLDPSIHRVIITKRFPTVRIGSCGQGLGPRAAAGLTTPSRFAAADL